MNLKEVSKRVQTAVDQAHRAKSKIKDYNQLALKLDEIAVNNNIPMEHIRRVSGIELNSISKVLKYKELGQEEKFIERFNKLEKYDQERVRKELGL